jgi:hypothetical protein
MKLIIMYYLQLRINSSQLGPNNFLSIICSNILNPRSWSLVKHLP